MEHPENLEELNSVNITDELREFISGVASDIEDERNHPERSAWEEKIDKFRRLRYGIRQRKVKPWPGASNFVIPLIDSDINRIKPQYVNLIAVSPIVIFEPYGSDDLESGRKREKLFDWRMRTKVKPLPQYALGVDRMLEQGQIVFKVQWKYKTRNYSVKFDLTEFDETTLDALYDARVDDELLFRMIVEQFRIDLDHEENEEEVLRVIEEFREGKQEFRLDLVETEDNKAEMIAVDLRHDLIVPADTMHINDARFIDYQFPISKNDLKIAMQDGKFEEYVDDDIMSWAGKNPSSRDDILYDDVDQETVWLHETCVWYDVNGDGIKERCIATWPDSDPSNILRFIELPYDHGKWPYVQIKRERVSDWFYDSRGIPEIDADFQIAISQFVNNTVDNGVITNSPHQVALKNSLGNQRNRRFTPGELIEVTGSINNYRVDQPGNVSQSQMLQLSQFMKSWADQRNGNITSGLSSSANLSGMGEGGKKTKAEIDLISGLSAQNASLDLQIFQDQMAEVFYQIDALYEQFGDDEEEILITNEPPVKVTRQEIQGRFNIVPNGRLDNSNPAIRLQKSFNALNLFNQDPYIKQRELRVQVANDLDDRMADRIVKTDEELAQEQQQQMAALEQQFGQQVQAKKVSDDLDIRKEMLLMPIQGKKHAPGE